MPVPEKRTELMVGLFLFIGLVLLGGLILQFGRFGERLAGHYIITVVFEDASGLIKGSEVRMGGARIGQVASPPELNEAVQVEVELQIQEKIRIPSGSEFQIASATLLGDKLIVIVPPEQKTGTYLQPGSRHRGAGPAGLTALQTNAETVIREVIRILKDSEATFGKIDDAVTDIRAASSELSQALGKINNSVLNQENLEHIDRAIANLDEVTARWNTASTQLDPTLTEAREAIREIRAAADRTEQTLSGLEPAFEKVPEAVGNISETAEKASAALDRMEQGEGLLGTLSTDDQASTDARIFLQNLRRYGILRYRNEPLTPEEDPRNRFRGKRR